MYLLDTNVVSETRKVQAHAGVMAFLQATSSAQVFLSVLTIGELRKGVASRRKSGGDRAADLEAWVDNIDACYADRIVPVDAASARLWGELSAGRSLPVVDTLLAATAMTRNLTLVTRNVSDFDSLPLLVLNPWA